VFSGNATRYIRVALDLPVQNCLEDIIVSKTHKTGGRDFPCLQKSPATSGKIVGKVTEGMTVRISVRKRRRSTADTASWGQHNPWLSKQSLALLSIMLASVLDLVPPSCSRWDRRELQARRPRRPGEGKPRRGGGHSQRLDNQEKVLNKPRNPEPTSEKQKLWLLSSVSPSHRNSG